MLWQHFFWIFGHPEVYILIFPGVRQFFRGNSDFFAQTDFWTAGDGGGGSRNRIHQPGRLGASYVRGWHDFLVEYLFRRIQHVVGIPTGIKIFNWTGDDVRREASFRNSHAFLSADSSAISSWPG